jgi:HAD superfamily hydrolase (TIGR01509 family)
MTLPSDYKDAVKSMGFPQAAAYTKRRFSLDETEEEIMAQWMRMARHEYAFNIPLKNGAGEYLKALHRAGVKLGLATASGPELYEPLLKRCGVYDLFSCCVTTVRAGRDKNYPNVYLLCAEELCCEPRLCMVFEDLLAAVITAKSVGFMTTGVFDPHWAAEQTEIEAAADFYITDFREVL